MKRKVLIGISLARGVVVTKNSRGGEVHRPAERLDLKPGDVFDFTEDEIDDIKATHGEGALSDSAEANLDDGEVKAAEVVSKTAAKGKGKGAKAAEETL
jgi:hypothetical protein